MLELNIEITGDTTDDLLLALDQAKRSIAAGKIKDSDINDTGVNYSFNIKQEAFNYG